MIKRVSKKLDKTIADIAFNDSNYKYNKLIDS